MVKHSLFNIIFKNIFICYENKNIIPDFYN
jgi:hypothetical protein